MKQNSIHIGLKLLLSEYDSRWIMTSSTLKGTAIDYIDSFM